MAREEAIESGQSILQIRIRTRRLACLQSNCQCCHDLQ